MRVPMIPPVKLVEIPIKFVQQEVVCVRQHSTWIEQESVLQVRAKPHIMNIMHIIKQCSLIHYEAVISLTGQEILYHAKLTF